jgi:aminoglycoside phosphotransferase (APT) family kinase protein
MATTPGKRIVSGTDATDNVVDLVALARFLREAGLFDGSEIEVGLLSGGRSNLTFVVDTGGQELIVRRRPLGPVARGAHDMEREFRVQSALQCSGVPVPTVRAFSTDETVVGAPFYVMDRVYGEVWDDPADVAHISAVEGDSCSRSVIDALVQLHSVDYRAIGLSDLGRPAGFLERRIGRWLQQWDQIDRIRELPLVAEVGRRLLLALPAEQLPGLVHGDYRLGNVMVSRAADRRVQAILDWEMSTLGDRLTDVAHLLIYWDSTRGRITHRSQLIAGTHGFWSGPEMAAAYGAATGAVLDDLDFYLAFEHWRGAIIKEGIHARSIRGETRGDGFEGIAEAVPLHLEEADQLLREAGR